MFAFLLSVSFLCNTLLWGPVSIPSSSSTLTRRRWRKEQEAWSMIWLKRKTGEKRAGEKSRRKSRRDRLICECCLYDKKREKDMAWIILKLVFVYRSLFLFFLQSLFTTFWWRLTRGQTVTASHHFLSFFSWTNNTQCRISFTHLVFTGMQQPKERKGKEQVIPKGKSCLQRRCHDSPDKKEVRKERVNKYFQEHLEPLLWSCH